MRRGFRITILFLALQSFVGSAYSQQAEGRWTVVEPHAMLGQQLSIEKSMLKLDERLEVIAEFHGGGFEYQTPTLRCGYSLLFTAAASAVLVLNAWQKLGLGQCLPTMVIKRTATVSSLRTTGEWVAVEAQPLFGTRLSISPTGNAEFVTSSDQGTLSLRFEGSTAKALAPDGDEKACVYDIFSTEDDSLIFQFDRGSRKCKSSAIFSRVVSKNIDELPRERWFMMTGVRKGEVMEFTTSGGHPSAYQFLPTNEHSSNLLLKKGEGNCYYRFDRTKRGALLTLTVGLHLCPQTTFIVP